MGSQQFGPKKIRKLAALTGLPLDMVWNHQGGGEWTDARTLDGDRCTHYLINVKTGEWEKRDPPSSHYSSCPRSQHDRISPLSIGIS